MKKIEVGAVAAAVFSGVCSAAMFELPSSATWTDLSALDGYDGVTVAAGQTLTLAPASGTMVFDKVIAGDGGIVKDGAGHLELKGDNTFNGTCIIGGTGNVYAYSNTALGSATGRTTLYAHLYTGGLANTGAAGASLYLCGITTSEGIDIVAAGQNGCLYALKNTFNTVSGSLTVNGGQTTVYAQQGAILRFSGGVSGAAGGSTLRPSAETGGQIIVSSKPLSVGLWNSTKGDGSLLLSAPGNQCGYTYLPIILGCDWALNNVGVNWETGGIHMKVDLNGYANRVSSIALTMADMNGWVTSTRGRAYLYNMVSADTTTYLPFRGQAGLFKEGAGTLTIKKNTKSASDTKGNLCVTNGAVVFDGEAAWPNVSEVILSGTGAVTLSAANQLGTPKVLDLSDSSVLTLPASGEMTVVALRLNGSWKAAGDYTSEQLGEHLVGEGAVVHVLESADDDCVNVFSDEVWDDSRLAALSASDCIHVFTGATLTMSNATAYVLKTPVRGAGTLVIDGNARFDLSNASPDFDGDLHLKGFGKRAVYLNKAESFGTTAGTTTFHVSYLDTSNADGAEIWFNGIATDETMTFKGHDSPCRIRAVSGTVNTFNGDVSVSNSQVSFIPEANAQFVFNKSFSGSGFSPSPKGDAQIVFNCPCTAGFFNSHETGGYVVFNVTGNSPLGYFCAPARFGVDFAWDNVDAVLGMKYYNNTKVNLFGHPQRVTSIYHYDSSRPLGNCTYVTDTTGDKTFLHVNTTANGDSRVYFLKTAGLCWENTGTVTFKETASTSQGDLLVEKGRVKFDTATWKGGDTATVKSGAVLELSDASGFSFNHIVIEDGGKLVVPNGGTLHVCDITVDGTTYPVGSTVSFADHPTSLEGAATVVCDGDYVIHVDGANADTVETVTVDIPAHIQRIVKTGKGTAYVTGKSAAETAVIVVKEGVLGVAAPTDIPVLLKTGLPAIIVEDGGTFETGCMDYNNAQPLRTAVLKLAGHGAKDSKGVSLGALRVAKRSGSETTGNRHQLFSQLVLNADATIAAAGMDCGCADAARKTLNGHTLTKDGAYQFYLGGTFSPGNFAGKNGNLIIYGSPLFEGGATNSFTMTGGSLMFNQCTEAMTPVPHTLVWKATNMSFYNKSGRWGGPWQVETLPLLMTNSKAPNNGSLWMTNSIVATNNYFQLSPTRPRLIVSGPQRHEFIGIQNAGQVEFRDGAEVWMNPKAGLNNEYSIAKKITDNVDYGLPASMLVSGATLKVPEPQGTIDKAYGSFVLSWIKDYAGELVIEGDSHLTGPLYCAWEGFGAVRQSGGEFIAKDVSGLNNSNSIGIQPAAGGAYVLDDGRFVSEAPMNAASVIGSVAVIRQNGGEFVTGVNGDFSTGNGTFSLYQAGGVFTNANNISFGGVADAAGSRAEVTVTGEGALQYHRGTVGIGGNNAVLQVSDGATLDLGKISHKSGSAQHFYFGADGGVLKVHQSGELFGGQVPDRATIYGGGLVIDTDAADGDVTVAAAFKKPTGKVVTGVALPADAEFLDDKRHMGPAKITIDGGSGFGATAVTEFDASTRALTAATVASPGFGFAAGDAVTATVEGPFRKASYTGAVTLGDPDLTGGLTKRGANGLVLNGANDYAGVTRIEGGSLEFTQAFPSESEVVITAEALNEAIASKRFVLTAADFPANGKITVVGAEKVALAGLERAIRVAKFTGDVPASLTLSLKDSSGADYTLPAGEELFYRAGSLRLGKQTGMMLIVR